jgi:hypothetical protein
MDNRPIDNRWAGNYMNNPNTAPQQLFNPLNPMIGNKYPPPGPTGQGLPPQNMYKNPMYNPPPPNQGQMGNYRMQSQNPNGQPQPNKYYDNRYNNYQQ